MNTVGQGVKEIRIRDFQKKTEKTSKADLDLATKRYRDLLKELGQ